MTQKKMTLPLFLNSAIKIYIVLSLYLIIQPIIAQPTIGVMGGLANTTLKGDAPSGASYSSLSGAAVSGIFELPIAQGVILSAQPGYVQKGTILQYEIRGQRDTIDSVTVRINYFSLPLLAKVSTKNKRFYVSSGLELSFPLSATYKTSSEDRDIMPSLESFDVAVNLGVGFMIPAGLFDLFLEARYSQSLLNTVKDSVEISEGALYPRLKNNGLQFYVGLLFTLSGNQSPKQGRL